MKIFQCSQDKKLIFLIGLGLIGTEIASLFFKEKKILIDHFKIDWEDPLYFKNRFNKILESFQGVGNSKIDFIWAAGKAGFGSSYEYCESEFLHFFNFLEIISNYKNKFPDQMTIHLVSSAGGLFEGQLMVSRNSVPFPKRPYGVFKLKQEEKLKEFFPDSYRIYRPSSVFGKIFQGKRLGLVTTLIENGLKNRETTIYGSQDTLRDFIFVEDVAKSILRVINLSDYFSDKVFFLVSGHSASIFEVIHFIKMITGKKFITRFVQVSDPLSICFSSQLNQFNCPNYEMGIRKILNDIS